MTTNKKNISLLFTALFFIAAVAITPYTAKSQSTANLQKIVSDISKEDALKHGTLAVSVYSLDKKSSVYGFNQQKSVIPASVTKIITTAAGFERLGSNFRFKTVLGYSGNIDPNGTLHGNLYIIGGGDPLLGSYRYKQTVPDSLFAAWKRAISAAGIKAVNGRVQYDASIFDNHPINDTWQWGDIGNYYGSGINGLNFHENMFFIHLTPGARIGYPATVSHTQPSGLALHIINEVTTGPAKTGDRVTVYGDPASTIRTCSGTMPLDNKNFSVRASLPKPGQACADLFTAYLRRNKINVSGAASEALKRPSNITTLLEYTSPTYSVIAQYTNMTSNNTYAEAIHRYLGYKAGGLGSAANGCKAIDDYIKLLKLEHSGVTFEDGCGLSRNNKVTTDFLCRFLTEVSKASYFEHFYKSLALAGENGTVKNMLKGLPAGVSVRMKSGSMGGIRAYSGYITNAKGNRYCFAIIANDYDCSEAQIKSKLEKIIFAITNME